MPATKITTGNPVNVNPINIKLPYGRERNYTRKVRDGKPTGIVSRTWAGTVLYQWEGWVWLFGEQQPVWAWSYTNAHPVEWSNDRG